MSEKSSRLIRILLMIGAVLCGTALSGCVTGPQEPERKPGVLERYCQSLEKDLNKPPGAVDPGGSDS